MDRVDGDVMKYLLEEVEYTVEIVRKNNKNTYVRVKEGNIIYVTTNRFTTKHQIKKLLDENRMALVKMANHFQKQVKDSHRFYYLGALYDIIIIPTIDEVEVLEQTFYTPSLEKLDKWLENQTRQLFQCHLDQIYPQFEEHICYPKLKFRKMKTRWGVCNRKTQAITLNTELIHYSIDCLDYVIVHELAHFVHFDHSKDFWNVVGKYCQNYKIIRKKLKG